MCNFKTDCADKPGFTELAKDICMQIAAANPTYLNKEQVPADVLEKMCIRDRRRRSPGCAGPRSAPTALHRRRPSPSTYAMR